MREVLNLLPNMFRFTILEVASLLHLLCPPCSTNDRSEWEYHHITIKETGCGRWGFLCVCIWCVCVSVCVYTCESFYMGSTSWNFALPKSYPWCPIQIGAAPVSTTVASLFQGTCLPHSCCDHWGAPHTQLWAWGLWGQVTSTSHFPGRDGFLHGFSLPWGDSCHC